ncbi:MAG: hypothetical protein ACI80V_003080 [Rhodothermales bacterium]|jgi:uncharacterized protein (TIGR02246 family)
MKPSIGALLILSTMLVGSFNKASAPDQTNSTMTQQSIEQTLARYFAALNASDTQAAVDQYSDDGVFMPTGAPTATGKEQLVQAYDHVFGTIRLNVAFTIEEIGIEGDLAFVRTASHGEVTVLGPGITAPEANRELFVFRNEAGVWKIARYMFNKSTGA